MLYLTLRQVNSGVSERLIPQVCPTSSTNTEGAMALGIVPNGIKLEFNAVQNGIPVVNRVFMTQTTSVTPADLDDVLIKALAFFNVYKDALHSSYVLQNLTATDVSVANGTQTILPLTTANTGTVGGVAAAANAAIVTSLRTNFTGRSFRGRWYWGGLAAAQLTNAQTFGTGEAATFSNIFMDFIDALATINKTLVVVSNYAAGLVRVVALATEIIAVITNTKVDSQRRRTAN